MAKLAYDHDGEFWIAGQRFLPTREVLDAAGIVTGTERIEHPISDHLAAEIHAALPHWEARGFRLIGYTP